MISHWAPFAIVGKRLIAEQTVMPAVGHLYLKEILPLTGGATRRNRERLIPRRAEINAVQSHAGDVVYLTQGNLFQPR
jgi:hypothetical protein